LPIAFTASQRIIELPLDEDCVTQPHVLLTATIRQAPRSELLTALPSALYLNSCSYVPSGASRSVAVPNP